jgi:quinol monooxygenase YgiN
MSFAVIARYVCRNEDADEIRAALLEMRRHTLEEPANLMYVVHEEIDEGATFILYEQYDDRAGFEAHTQTPHFARLIVDLIRPRLLERIVYFGDVL